MLTYRTSGLMLAIVKAYARDGAKGMTSLPFILSGVLKEAWRRVTGEKVEAQTMHVSSVHPKMPSGR